MQTAVEHAYISAEIIGLLSILSSTTASNPNSFDDEWSFFTSGTCCDQFALNTHAAVYRHKSKVSAEDKT